MTYEVAELVRVPAVPKVREVLQLPLRGEETKTGVELASSGTRESSCSAFNSRKFYNFRYEDRPARNLAFIFLADSLAANQAS